MDRKRKSKESAGTSRGLGDEQGTRVGRPEQGARNAPGPIGASRGSPKAGKEARPGGRPESAGLEGSLLGDDSSERDTDQADGQGEGRDDAAAGKASDARSSGMGSEGAKGIHDRQKATGGTGQPAAVHKPGYGGEAGEPRTSSDTREPRRR